MDINLPIIIRVLHLSFSHTILSSTLPEDVSVNVVKSCPKLNIVSNTPSRIVVCGRDLACFSLFFLAISNS